VNVERLLNMLRALDPSKGDNLADDEEIQVGVSLCFPSPRPFSVFLFAYITTFSGRVALLVL
jgi:hypothetical protein